MQAKDLPDELVLCVVNALGRDFCIRCGQPDPLDELADLRKHADVQINLKLAGIENSTPVVVMQMPVPSYVAGRLELRWASVWDIEDSLALHIKEPIPTKVVTAKLKRLIKRELLTGCVCGCRGDFAVTLTSLSNYDLELIAVAHRYP